MSHHRYPVHIQQTGQTVEPGSVLYEIKLIRMSQQVTHIHCLACTYWQKHTSTQPVIPTCASSVYSINSRVVYDICLRISSTHVSIHSLVNLNSNRHMKRNISKPYIPIQRMVFWNSPTSTSHKCVVDVFALYFANLCVLDKRFILLQIFLVIFESIEQYRWCVLCASLRSICILIKIC